MGTVQIVPGLVTTPLGGRAASFSDPGWCADSLIGVGSSDAELINGASAGIFMAWDSGAVLNASLRFSWNQSAPAFLLDGSLTPISFNDLPSGLVFTALTLVVKTGGYGIGLGGSGTFSINGDTQNIPISDGVTTFVLSWNLVEVGHTLDPLDFIDLIFEWLLSTTFGGVTGVADIEIGSDTVTPGWYLTGTYTIQAVTATLVTPTNPVDTGDHITVTSVGPPAQLDLSQVLTVSVTYGATTVLATIVSKTEDELIFALPTIPSDADVLIVTITSTEFSGSVTLGKLITIYFINAPGIYTLTAGATADTLYDVQNGGTVDVKIPNPTFKTAFIGG